MTSTKTKQAGNLLDQRTQDFLDVLHAGGQFRFLQNLNAGDAGKARRSVWFKIDEPIKLPKHWLGNDYANIFFCVNPSSIAREAWQASHNEDIQLLNCLYAEFDGKDFTDPSPDEIELAYQNLRSMPNKNAVIEKALRNEAAGAAKSTKYATDPDYYKGLAKTHIDELSPSPSVIVNSGGGYQAYWLLDEPFLIDGDDELRQTAKTIQKRWVHFVGADRGVHDLRRILRVPGTYNHKKKYAPTYPLVEFLEYNLDTRYVLDDLVALLPPPEPEPEKPEAKIKHKVGGETGRNLIDEFNENNDIRDLLIDAGFTGSGNRLSRPGEEESKGVIIFTDTNTSFHHSSSDPLYDADHTRSPFDVYCEFEYKGDLMAAFEALKREKGLWTEKGERARVIDPKTGEIITVTKTKPVLNGTGSHSPQEDIHDDDEEDFENEDIDLNDEFDSSLDDEQEPTPTNEESAATEQEAKKLTDLNPLDYRAEDGGVMDAWVDLYGNDWRFIVGPDKWRSWNSTHWGMDQDLSLTRQIIHLLDYMNLKCEEAVSKNKKMIRKLEDLNQGDEAAETAKAQIKKLKQENEVWNNMLRSTKRSGARVASIEKLCKGVKAISVNELDKDDSLNMLNGIYSLAGLNLRPHSRDELFTYCLDYEYDPEGQCPLFLKFISDVLVKEKPENSEWVTDNTLVDLFQELLGYSLTTHVKREVMVWMFGDGGNGKSVVIAIIEALLGGLAGSVDFQSLGLPGNYELADIPGKRVIFATEADRGGTLAEKYIKQIVSGDTLKARPIYGSPMEFKSMAKIWWSMNDRPIIRDTSDSIWRRMRLIPFYRKFEEPSPTIQEKPSEDEDGSKIKKSTADVDLIPKLIKELPGILNWAIDGLVRLNRNRKFTYSEAAETAKKEYREESNPVQRWVNTMCTKTNSPATLQSALFFNYAQWSRDQNEKAITSTQFGKDLGRLKIKKERKTAGFMYNLALLDTHSKEPPE